MYTPACRVPIEFKLTAFCCQFRASNAVLLLVARFLKKRAHFWNRGFQVLA